VAVRVLRHGTRRAAGGGLRLGTVRRPPRGVPKARFAKDDWYELWLPELAPSDALFANSGSRHDISAVVRRCLRLTAQAPLLRADWVIG